MGSDIDQSGEREYRPAFSLRSWKRAIDTALWMSGCRYQVTYNLGWKVRVVKHEGRWLVGWSPRG